MKKVLGLFLVVGLALLIALPALSMPQGADNLSFSGQSMSKVPFDHLKHKGLVSDCKDCHHQGVGTGKCTDCHGGDDRARSKKRAFHGNCKDCHAERGVSGRRDCNFCHRG